MICRSTSINSCSRRAWLALCHSVIFGLRQLQKGATGCLPASASVSCRSLRKQRLLAIRTGGQAASGTRNPTSAKALALVLLLGLGPLAGLAVAQPGTSKAVPNAPGQVRADPARDERHNRVNELRKRLDEDPELAADGEDSDVETAPAAPGGFRPDQLVSPTGLGSTLNLVAVTTVLTLAPSILIMTTCFVRFAIVLGLLRQALGTQQLPPNQVMMGLCLFLTCMVMSPVWQRSYNEGIRPYTQGEPGQSSPSLEETFHKSVGPVREFMADQIEAAGNGDTVWMFLDYQNRASKTAGAATRDPAGYDEVPLATLVSSYVLSELKTAFIIGFQIYLPFLVVDLVVAAVLMSMGMNMLPPTLVSLPFKLLLFVLIDGWTLTVGMMLNSVTR